MQREEEAGAVASIDPSLQDWCDQNQAGPKMVFKGPAAHQIAEFAKLPAALGLDDDKLTVVSSHTSKSIKLPVVAIECAALGPFIRDPGRFLLRDNFHDVNLCVLWPTWAHERLLRLTYEQVYGPPLSWDWYLEEVVRADEYSWANWTREELHDKRILRVKRTRADGGSYWPSPVKPEEKKRWVARMTDPAWFGTDWSSGRLFFEGGMGPGCQIYRARQAHLQGISGVVDHDATELWEPGKARFTVALPNLGAALRLMRVLVAPPEPTTGGVS